jgi:hypothetical protein
MAALMRYEGCYGPHTSNARLISQCRGSLWPSCIISGTLDVLTSRVITQICEDVGVKIYSLLLVTRPVGQVRV